MTNLQNKKVALVMATAIQKIPMAVSETGAIVNKKHLKGNSLMSSSHEKGKVILFDEKGKRFETVNIGRMANQTTEKADKKKYKDDKPL